MRRVNIFLLVTLCVCAGSITRAVDTNSLVWQPERNQVSADLHGEALWPLLEDIAHQTGWHIFVEPGASHNASARFRDLPAGEALPKLLGDLNYAMVPQTNGPQQLYVFKTTMYHATQRVTAPPKAAPMKHVANQLLVKLKPGADIDAIAKAHGAKVVSRNDKLGIYLLQLPDASATDTALAGLKTDPQVASVDYNYIFDAPPTPQPLASAPAGAAPVSLTLSPNTPTDPCTPIVGLIDTGVQSLGSQLDQFMLPAINVTGDTTALSTTTPTHGTAMAYTIVNGVSQQNKSSSLRTLPGNAPGVSGGPPSDAGNSSSVRILPVNVFGNS